MTGFEVVLYQNCTLVMEQSSQVPLCGAVTGDTPAAYAAITYQPAVMVSGAPAVGGAVPPASQGAPAYPVIPAQLTGQHHLAYQQAHQFQQQQQQHQQQKLQAFWAGQMAEIEQTTEFKIHSLPLARIKKIMKADEDVRMIAGEAPVVFAKACEMFILELTLRAWLHTEENKRRTLQKSDIAAAITRTDIFDFLIDIVPRDELKEDTLGLPAAALETMGTYYVPGMSMPVGLYPNQQPAMYMWQQPPQQQQQQISDGGEK